MTAVPEVPAAAALLRRAPVQERSAARVQRMLDAAAALLDEVGYERTTTSLVARRAGVSVGSLYQFFPDRQAVVQALARRSFERFAERLEARLDPPPAGWQGVLDAVVDTYVEVMRREPGFRVLSFGGPVSDTTLDPAADNNAIVAAVLGDLLRRVAPDLPRTDEVTLALRLAVETGDALLTLAFRHDPDGDPAVVAEARRLLAVYLQDVLGRS